MLETFDLTHFRKRKAHRMPIGDRSEVAFGKTLFGARPKGLYLTYFRLGSNMFWNSSRLPK